MLQNKSFAIHQLKPADSAIIADFMKSQTAEYLKFFYAFSENEAEIKEMLSAAELDAFYGVFWQGDLAGIFMLRGYDAGYEIPSFGVLIADEYRGGAFMRLTLDTAKLICRLSGKKVLMAKIHPDNISPKGAVRLGFKQIEVEESTGNVIYQMEL